MPWWKDYNLWTAVGTVGAVVVAVLGSLFRAAWIWFRRPVLTLRCENRDPWKRLSRAQDDRVWLFFRISVENIGHRMARGVKGFAFEFLDEHGQPREKFDPFVLHWVGTDFSAIPTMNLLPGQREFLDVLQILHSNPKDQRVDASDAVFVLIPQVEIARGLQLFDKVRGETVSVRVSGEDADMVGMTISLPFLPRGHVTDIQIDAKLIESADLLQSWRSHRKVMGI